MAMGIDGHESGAAMGLWHRQRAGRALQRLSAGRSTVRIEVQVLAGVFGGGLSAGGDLQLWRTGWLEPGTNLGAGTCRWRCIPAVEVHYNRPPSGAAH